MHITTKGQVTIPQEIREQFGFLPHCEVKFMVENNKVFLLKVADNNSRRGKRLIQKMRGRGDIKISTDEIIAMTRK